MDFPYLLICFLGLNAVNLWNESNVNFPYPHHHPSILRSVIYHKISVEPWLMKELSAGQQQLGLNQCLTRWKDKKQN